MQSERRTSGLRAVVAFLALFVVVLGAVSCSKNAPAESRQAMADAAAPAPAADASGVAASGRGFAASREKAVLSQQAQLPSPRGVDSVVPSMIIRNGSVSIEVDSLETAVAAVRALATRLGGYVGNVVMNTGEYSVRNATLEVKIPSARFEEAMTNLTPIGKVEQSSSTAEDVGEEFVDLTARMSNARRLEERLVTLLTTRTGKLEDVLAVERELARVREEIERFEGRLRFLRARVSMSTLSVTVHEEAPLVSPNPGTNVLGEAVKAMWRNFVTFIAAIIASLGVVVPIAAIAGGLYWWWRRGRRQPPATA
ncbi:MAG: DUF4349 domain-containing protein [Gemmatimonadaceae bacterium]